MTNDELSTSEMKVLQHNLTHLQGEWDAAISAIEKWEKESGGPVVATLQEVCFDTQYKPVFEKKKSTWLMDFHPVKGAKAGGRMQARANEVCPNPDGSPASEGHVIIYTGKRTGADGTDHFNRSFNPDYADRMMDWGMVCAKFPWHGLEVVACSTKLVMGIEANDLPENLRIKQAKYLDDFAREQRSKGWYVVIAGDMNTSPGKEEMDFLYKKNGKGIFCEADEKGQCTGRGGQVTSGNGNKLDYVFFQVNRFQSATLAVRESPSDHKRLKAKAKISLGNDSASYRADDDPPPPQPPPPPACTENECWRATLGVGTYEEPNVSDPSNKSLDRIVFDRKFYINVHADVRAAAEASVAMKGGTIYQYGEWHWLHHGIAEGRMGSATFDPIAYMNWNPDVSAAYGWNNYQAAINHYMNNGRFEGRRASVFFDASTYYNRYGDLQAALGWNPSALLNHFHNNGMQEGRQASGEFAPAWYLGVNPDVRDVYGENNYRGGMYHWLAYGRAAGRPGAP
ncbi:endonuclease/exonuclease/phosphatase family protein [Polyangium aurulentum]|uniref:endonuclease/exonuclease/phosphatase family protein n=1 Tax=Polyangium aurulentum TaxID=2567896 RepID=UPI0010AE5301|nr:endonuclease/exonuclease/phosphatase family protein [Polyangium aurulentum]UQA57263.1 endonuclease/exonuclease/phosphatase family protein [Polyangium aurulentum]